MALSGFINGELASTEQSGQVVESRDGLVVVKTEAGLREVFVEGKTASDGNSVPGVEIIIESERERVIRERFSSTGTGGSDGGGGASATHTKVVKAPMPGLVKAISVAVGDHVKRNTTVIILEAMKMENSIAAGTDGIIKKLMISTGGSIEKGAPICEIEQK